MRSKAWSRVQVRASGTAASKEGRGHRGEADEVVEN